MKLEDFGGLVSEVLGLDALGFTVWGLGLQGL